MAEFTNLDKEYAKHINKAYKWMTRDKNGDLYVYSGKPHKAATVWLAPDRSSASVWEDDILDGKLFEAVQWTDEEPTLISDIYGQEDM